MKALIIAAHGSRKKESNEEILKLAQKVAKIRTHDFDSVSAAFIQFTEPLLADEIDGLAERNAEKIVVFPYFLGAGSHVIKDIPDIIYDAGDRHPHISFSVPPHLGRLAGIEHLIIDEVSKY
ncbi:MAG: CbiX/SirB N-terminal domain-containing protein [Desulfobacteraceae bacterium]